ncbi:MAG: 16S rRNA (guanine(527)-N(7))-methyltransferase RsmG [candidate division WOR-3 bacterium]
MKLLKIDFDDSHIEKFKKYLEILYEFRGKLNLIADGDYPYIAVRHFLESLLALPYLPPGIFSGCDLGAGAGFPGLPLKIMRSEMDLTLIESKKKKALFLNRLIVHCQIIGVSVLATRAESIKNRKFDVIFCRAVGRIRDVIDCASSLSTQNGIIVFYKSHNVEEEIGEAKRLFIKFGLKISKIDKLYSPIEHRPIALVIIEHS